MKRSLAIVLGLGLLVLTGCRNDDQSSRPAAAGTPASTPAGAPAGTDQPVPNTVPSVEEARLIALTGEAEYLAF